MESSVNKDQVAICTTVFHNKGGVKKKVEVGSHSIIQQTYMRLEAQLRDYMILTLHHNAASFTSSHSEDGIMSTVYSLR